MPTIFTNISTLVLPNEAEGNGNPITEITDAELEVDDNGLLTYVGPKRNKPPDNEKKVVNIASRAVVPGFVDSHTHVVFGGDRLKDFVLRTRGESYQSIAKAGGGINHSRTMLKITPTDEIVAQSLKRLKIMREKGVTTVEVKSGYGLTPEEEFRHLELIKETAKHTPQTVISTLLAHKIPPEWQGTRQAFISEFIEKIIKVAVAKGLCRNFDVFVDTMAFTEPEARILVTAAKENGLKIKLHVDQFRDDGGAEFAASVGALSADHLERVSEKGAAALTQSGVVATILPMCTLYLGSNHWTNGRLLRDAGCEVGIATDCNPGSAMTLDLCMAAALAILYCGLSFEEALWGITCGGAKALGLKDRGRLKVGEKADFVVVDHSDWRAIFGTIASPPILNVYIGGK